MDRIAGEARSIRTNADSTELAMAQPPAARACPKHRASARRARRWPTSEANRSVTARVTPGPSRSHTSVQPPRRVMANASSGISHSADAPSSSIRRPPSGNPSRGRPCASRAGPITTAPRRRSLRTASADRIASPSTGITPRSLASQATAIRPRVLTCPTRSQAEPGLPPSAAPPANQRQPRTPTSPPPRNPQCPRSAARPARATTQSPSARSTPATPRESTRTPQAKRADPAWHAENALPCDAKTARPKQATTPHRTFRHAGDSPPTTTEAEQRASPTCSAPAPPTPAAGGARRRSAPPAAAPAANHRRSPPTSAQRRPARAAP